MLTNEQKERYIRQIKLPGFGLEAQEKLLAARVLIVGAGGLGCPVGLYLAAAGIGTIGVIDNDSVDLSNLQRQVAYKTSDIGNSKAEKLVASMRDINPQLKFEIFRCRLDESNAENILQNWDLVIDGTDNFSTRFLVADACYFLKRPLLSGAVYQFSAQMVLIIPNETPCYRCFFSEPPEADVLEACSEVGVLGPVVGTAGTLMATEAIKFLSGLRSSIKGTMLLYDALTQEIRHIEMERDSSCALCGDNPSIKQIKQNGNSVCRDTLDVETMVLSVEQAEKFLRTRPAILLDVREPHEFNAGHLPNALSFPLSQLEGRRQELSKFKDPIIAYCHLGIRSLRFVELLRQLGINESYSVTGGIEAWTEKSFRPL